MVSRPASWKRCSAMPWSALLALAACSQPAVSTDAGSGVDASSSTQDGSTQDGGRPSGSDGGIVDPPSDAMSFFVTSRPLEVGGAPVTGGDLGGIAGADAFCAELARAVLPGDGRTWKAYLSSPSEDARDRIGNGPWFNARGERIADDVESLHASPPRSDLILDENGDFWDVGGRHDILTGSGSDGRGFGSIEELARYFDFPDGSFSYPDRAFDFSCMGWTTDGPGGMDGLTHYAVVGHVDWDLIDGAGLVDPDRGRSWNSSHVTACDRENMSADQGDQRVYCFAVEGGS